MAIAATPLTDSGSESDSATYNTASINPTANRLVLLHVASMGDSSDAGAIPSSVTGNNLTWVQVATALSPGNVRNTVFRALGSSPSSGAATITFPDTQGNATWSVIEFSGVHTGGTNGSMAVVQAVTANGTAASGAVTLASFANAANATYVTFAIDAAQNLLPTSFTEFADNNTGAPAHASAAAYFLGNDTSADYEWSSSVNFAAIGIEVRDASDTSGEEPGESSSTSFQLLGIS